MRIILSSQKSEKFVDKEIENALEGYNDEKEIENALEGYNDEKEIEKY